jgi:alpha-galactosidase
MKMIARGVDLIKLDYVTPGSPDNGGNLPANNSGSVIAYHNAIANSGSSIRLDISWKLERNSTYMDIWESSADSMRTDQDINNSKADTLVSWATVQRAIDNYRDYVAQAVSRSTEPILSIFPDMDNWYVGNSEDITGVDDTKRTTIASHWIGAAANTITGSDLTQLDDAGKGFLTYPFIYPDLADFTAAYPMQPRNPGTGGTDSKQLQAWIGGPGDDGRVLIVLVNYGPDEGQGGFGTQLTGSQEVSVSWEDLGISGSYQADEIWNQEDPTEVSGSISATLVEGESRMFMLTPSNSQTRNGNRKLRNIGN